MISKQRQLEIVLDTIWSMGDKDEMSIKHIGHALAAMIAHNDWRKGDDYTYPDCILTADDKWDKEATEALLKEVAVYWDKVTEFQSEWGEDEFRQIVFSSKFSFYPKSYLESSWLSYANSEKIMAEN